MCTGSRPVVSWGQPPLQEEEVVETIPTLQHPHVQTMHQAEVQDNPVEMGEQVLRAVLQEEEEVAQVQQGHRRQIKVPTPMRPGASGLSTRTTARSGHNSGRSIQRSAKSLTTVHSGETLLPLRIGTT